MTLAKRRLDVGPPMKDSRSITVAPAGALLREQLRGAPATTGAIDARGIAVLGTEGLVSVCDIDDGDGGRGDSMHRTFELARLLGPRPMLAVLASRRNRTKEAVVAINEETGHGAVYPLVAAPDGERLEMAFKLDLEDGETVTRIHACDERLVVGMSTGASWVVSVDGALDRLGGAIAGEVAEQSRLAAARARRGILGALGALGSFSARKIGLRRAAEEAEPAPDEVRGRGVASLAVYSDDALPVDELLVLLADGVAQRWALLRAKHAADVLTVHDALHDDAYPETTALRRVSLRHVAVLQRHADRGWRVALYDLPLDDVASVLPFSDDAGERRGRARACRRDAPQPAAGAAAAVVGAPRDAQLAAQLVGAGGCGGAQVRLWATWLAGDGGTVVAARVSVWLDAGAGGDVAVTAAAARTLRAGAGERVVACGVVDRGAFDSRGAGNDAQALVVLRATGDAAALDLAAPAAPPSVALGAAAAALKAAAAPPGTPACGADGAADARDASWADLVRDVSRAAADETGTDGSFTDAASARPRLAEAASALARAAALRCRGSSSAAADERASLARGASAASRALIDAAAGAGAGDDDAQLCAQVVLRALDRKRAAHGALLDALAACGAADAAAAAVADDAARCAAAHAAAAAHAQLLVAAAPAERAAADLLSAACKRCVARGPGYAGAAALAAAGLSFAEAFYATASRGLDALTDALLGAGGADVDVVAHLGAAARAAIFAAGAARAQVLKRLRCEAAAEPDWLRGADIAGACRAFLAAIPGPVSAPPPARQARPAGRLALRDVRGTVLDISRLLLPAAAGDAGAVDDARACVDALVACADAARPDDARSWADDAAPALDIATRFGADEHVVDICLRADDIAVVGAALFRRAPVGEDGDGAVAEAPPPPGAASAPAAHKAASPRGEAPALAGRAHLALAAARDAAFAAFAVDMLLARGLVADAVELACAAGAPAALAPPLRFAALLHARDHAAAARELAPLAAAQLAAAAREALAALARLAAFVADVPSAPAVDDALRCAELERILDARRPEAAGAARDAAALVEDALGQADAEARRDAKLSLLRVALCAASRAPAGASRLGAQVWARAFAADAAEWQAAAADAERSALAIAPGLRRTLFYELAAASRRDALRGVAAPCPPDAAALAAAVALDAGATPQLRRAATALLCHAAKTAADDQQAVAEDILA
ncbi:hypothetical protein M885DRAFT_627004 [Pelagophyceae sp. CCMP2097]|nr:hypothetical protein M885DRAFT_627004 [Pelagophyceae sp. CCMP2097]